MASCSQISVGAHAAQSSTQPHRVAKGSATSVKRAEKALDAQNGELAASLRYRDVVAGVARKEARGPMQPKAEMPPGLDPPRVWRPLRRRPKGVRVPSPATNLMRDLGIESVSWPVRRSLRELFRHVTTAELWDAETSGGGDAQDATVGSMAASLRTLADDGRLCADLIRQLVRVLEAQSLAKDPALSGVSLVRSTLFNLAYPDRINQGRTPTCSMSTQAIALAISHPEVYARTVADLAVDGTSETLAGARIELLPHSGQSDGRGRNAAHRILTSSLMSLVNPKYTLADDVPKAGSGAVDPALQKIYGTDTALVSPSRAVLSDSNGRIAREAKRGPVVCILDWWTSAHMFLLTGMDDQYLYYLSDDGTRRNMSYSDFQDRHFSYYSRGPCGPPVVDARHMPARLRDKRAYQPAPLSARSGGLVLAELRKNLGFKRPGGSARLLLETADKIRHPILMDQFIETTQRLFAAESDTTPSGPAAVSSDERGESHRRALLRVALAFARAQREIERAPSSSQDERARCWVADFQDLLPERLKEPADFARFDSAVNGARSKLQRAEQA